MLEINNIFAYLATVLPPEALKLIQAEQDPYENLVLQYRFLEMAGEAFIARRLELENQGLFDGIRRDWLAAVAKIEAAMAQHLADHPHEDEPIGDLGEDDFDNLLAMMKELNLDADTIGRVVAIEAQWNAMWRRHLDVVRRWRALKRSAHTMKARTYLSALEAAREEMNQSQASVDSAVALLGPSLRVLLNRGPLKPPPVEVGPNPPLDAAS